MGETAGVVLFNRHARHPKQIHDYDENKNVSVEVMVGNLNARSLVKYLVGQLFLVLLTDSDVFYQNPFFPPFTGMFQIASDNDYAPSKSVRGNEERRLDNSNNLSTEIV